MKRNGNIELLRFVFCIFIILLHAEFEKFGGGYLGVEFFFMISGAFMAKSISGRIKEEGKISFSQALAPARQYLRKRVGAVFPYLLISTLIGACVRVASGEWPLRDSLYYLAILPSDFMLSQSYGISTVSFTGVVWYLCASFFAMAMLYPIMRCWYDGYIRYYALIVALALCGIVQQNCGMPDAPMKFLSQMFNAGLLRAVAMVSLGGFVYEMSVKLGKVSFSKFGLRLLTVSEIILYLGVLFYMAVRADVYARADSYIVLCMALAVALTLSGKSYTYGKLDCKPVLFLGKFSVVLYLNHYYWLMAAKTIFGVSVTMKLLAIGLSFLTSFVVYALGAHMTTGLKLLKRLVVEDKINA